MRIERPVFTFLMTAGLAACLTACSSGITSLDKPSGSLVVQPLANDDPIYQQARVLVEERSDDGRWAINVVERGPTTFRDQQVVLIDNDAGRGYALPQLSGASSIVGAAWSTQAATGDATSSDSVSFTAKNAYREPMFTLVVTPDEVADSVQVAYARGSGTRYGTFTSGAATISITTGSGLLNR